MSHPETLQTSRYTRLPLAPLITANSGMSCISSEEQTHTAIKIFPYAPSPECKTIDNHLKIGMDYQGPWKEWPLIDSSPNSLYYMGSFFPLRILWAIPARSPMTQSLSSSLWLLNKAIAVFRVSVLYLTIRRKCFISVTWIPWSGHGLQFCKQK